MTTTQDLKVTTIKTKKKVVYLSGPMRGIEDFNYPAFHDAAEELRLLGYEVINPAESFDGDTSLSWETYMRADIEALLQSDYVFVLPGWERSRGARIEVSVAYALGLPVCDYTENFRNLDVSWLVEPPKPESDKDAQETVLQEAQRIVYGARQKDYGHPFEDFNRTAKIWSAILNVPVTAEQVALCMIGLKVSRLCNTPGHRDSMVDIAGYAGTYELVREKR